MPGLPTPSLDMPPPSPALSGGTGTGMVPQPNRFAGLSPNQPFTGPTPEIVQGILAAGAEIGKVLVTLAQQAPVAAREFEQARALIDAGVTKFLSANAAAGAPQESTGTQFPGGGFTAGQPF